MTSNNPGSKFPISSLNKKLSNIPLERAVVQHVCIDYVVVCPTTGNYLGRPWLTLLIDECSRKILAFHLSIDSPSYVSIMMVIRECVRNNSRLPKTIVTSDSKEFQNIHLGTLLSALTIQRITYSKERFPIYGGVFTNLINSIVKTIGTVLGVGRSGPTLELISLITIISDILYRIYDQQIILSLGASPREIYNSMQSIRRLPPEIMYDDAFIMLTLPQIEKVIHPEKGIRIREIYYWTDEFLWLCLVRNKVMVKIDPLNLDNVFAYIAGNWLKLTTYLKGWDVYDNRF